MSTAPLAVVGSFGNNWPTVCGYYPNELKTYLVVKSNKEEEAREVFKRTEVQITCVGSNYLGGALGTKCFEEDFMAEKIVQ